MKHLLFGTAGIPVSTKPRNTIEGIKCVRSLGLGTMELEFVYSVNINEKSAPAVRKTAQENGIVLTCHGQYYVNLNSDKQKTLESAGRILKAARIAWLCGAWSVCFHAGFYMGMERNAVYETIKAQLASIADKLKKEKNNIWLRPELTGKATQFGDLEELLQLSKEINNVMPCIDFSHCHARSGRYNSYKEFSGILQSVEDALGKKGLKNLHAHVSGIAYSAKGERNHLNFKQSDIKYKELMKALKDFGAAGVVISESPNIEGDALLMKRAYEKTK
ncbi:MAG: TIM barrel protein [Candidatus Aenigmatarchaeota archaeon]